MADIAIYEFCIDDNCLCGWRWGEERGDVGGGSVMAIRVASVKIDKRKVNRISNCALFVGSTIVNSIIRTGIVGTGGGCNCTELVGIVAPSRCHMRPGYTFTEEYKNYRVRRVSCSHRLIFGSRGVHKGLRQVNNFAGRRVRTIVRPIIKVRRPFDCHGGTRFPFKASGRNGPVAKFCTKEARSVVTGASYTLNMSRGQRVLRVVLRCVHRGGVGSCSRGAKGNLVQRTLVHCNFGAGRVVIYLIIGKGGLPGTRQLVRGLVRVRNVADVAVDPGAQESGIVVKSSCRVL